MLGIYGITAVLALSTGIVPLGIPPLPEMQLTSKIAPADCLFYFSSSGMAEPDAGSANQAEQLLAEPEVKRFAGEIEQLIRNALDKNRGRGGPPLTTEEIVRLMKIPLTQPLAVYLTNVKITDPRQPPDVQAGAIIHLGDQADFVRSLLDRMIGPLHLPEVEIGGMKWTQIRPPAPGAPLLTFGLMKKYLVFAEGDGEMERLLHRAKGAPPEWLKQLRGELSVERVSTVTYVNVKKIVGQYLPLGGPQVMTAGEAFGIMNVTAFKAVTGLDAKGCVLRALVAIDGAPQGLFKIAEAKPLTAEELGRIPENADFAIAARLNPPAFYDAFIELALKMNPGKEAEIHADLAQMDQTLGFKLREEVLEALGDSVYLFSMDGAPAGAVTGVGVIPLKNPQLAARSQQKIVDRLQGMLSGAQSAAGAAPRLSRIPDSNPAIYAIETGQPLPFTPCWCVTEKELVFAANPQAIESYLKSPAQTGSFANNPIIAESLKGDYGPIVFFYSDLSKKFGPMYAQLAGGLQMIKMQLAQQGTDLNIPELPPAGAIQPHLIPSLSTIRRTKAGLEATDRVTLPGLNPSSAGTVGGVGVALLLPAVQAAREAARRVHSMNNMKQIALAMLNYLDNHRRFPPAYSTDKPGKPLLSWRVLILPYLEEEELYKQFHLDEPWDSEHNKALIERMPAVYQNPNLPAGQGKTNYLTVRGPNTIFPGQGEIRPKDIVDGFSNTIMTVEAPAKKAVVWTKPDDFEYDEQNPLRGLTGFRPGIFLAGLADGSVRPIVNSIDPKILKYLFERNDGQFIPEETMEKR
jgi:hypothetical protein